MAQAGGQPDFWGYLFNPDKSPTETLDAFLKGIASLICNDVEPAHVRLLTPDKLAEFYRTVGGNYDSLFLETPHSALSFMYKSLGCAHSLQPTANDFAFPTVPTLEPRGFVRYQAVHILLGPEHHVPYLQEAANRFNIIDYRTGQPFPKVLPTEAFPLEPDAEMVAWKQRVFSQLEREAEEERNTPREEIPSTRRRPSDLQVSPIENRHADDYFGRTTSHDRRGSRSRHDSESSGSTSSPESPYHSHHEWHGKDTRGGHRNLRSRRNSNPEQYYSSSPYLNSSSPPSQPHPPTPYSRPPRNHRHSRNSSTSSSSSSGADDPPIQTNPSIPARASVQLPLRPTLGLSPQFMMHDPPSAAQWAPNARRFSDLPPAMPEGRRGSLPGYSRELPGYSPSAPPLSQQSRFSPFLEPIPPGPPRTNYRGHNVRFRRDGGYVYEVENSRDRDSRSSRRNRERDRDRDRRRERGLSKDRSRSASRSRSSSRHRDRAASYAAGDRPRVTRINSPLRGVDGRRYAAAPY